MTELTHDRLTELLNYDPAADVWTLAVDRAGRFAGSVVGKKPADTTAYRGLMVDKKKYLLHRLVWFWHHKAWPDGEIDHINRDRHDNRIANLRVVTRAENSWNSKARRGSYSGLKGVFPYNRAYATGQWLAAISVDGKRKRIGIFDCKFEAYQAFRREEEKHRGKFAPSFASGIAKP